MGRLAVCLLLLGVASTLALSEGLRGVQNDDASLQAQVSAEKAKINELEAQNQKDRSTFLNFIKKASNIMGQDNKIFQGVNTKTGEIKADMSENKPEVEAQTEIPAKEQAAASDRKAVGADAGVAETANTKSQNEPGVEPPKDEKVDDEEVKDKASPLAPQYATAQTYPGHGLMEGSNKEQVFRYAAPPPGGAPPRNTEAELKDPTTVKKKEEEDHSKYNLFEALPSPDEPIEPIVVEETHDIPRATAGYSLNPPPPGPQNYAEPAPSPQVDTIHQTVGADGIGGPPMGEIPLNAAAGAAATEEQADVAAVSGAPQ